MLEHDLVKECQDFAKSDAVKELFKRLEDKYISAWTQTSPKEKNEREDYYFILKAIWAFQSELEIVAQSTKVKEWNAKLQRLQV